MRTELIRPFPGAITNWTYVPSRPTWRDTTNRVMARLKRQASPDAELLKPPKGHGRWLLYFLFLPNGQLTIQHLFTLERLAAEDARLMIVCACPPGHPVLANLMERCSALCWKAINGFDFSAYAFGLTELAHHVPGSDVLVLNDSMLGPFASLCPFIEQAPWSLSGFTANSQLENHLQSYAFILKGVDLGIVNYLSAAMSTKWSYNRIGQVILLQETRLARVAQKNMSVGAFWYTDGSRYQDLCLNCPEQMLDAGFPLLKRSLFGKFAGVFQSTTAMQDLLRRIGHPEMVDGA